LAPEGLVFADHTADKTPSLDLSDFGSLETFVRPFFLKISSGN
jgi:hypothetical protein